MTGDLAKLLGVTANTIRRYSKEGFLTPSRDISNYRWYESYDIDKAAMIRLYIKCGFTHEEIKSMLHSHSENIMEMCSKKLENIDSQIERYTRLRHWLKDNIQLMKTVNELKDSFLVRKCPAIKFVIFSIEDEILNEKKRLETINHFMYTAPEVQLISIYDKKDIENNKRPSARTGWAVKESDIEIFNMQNIVKDNIYVEYQPSVECLYHSAEIPLKDMYDEKRHIEAVNNCYDKIWQHMKENGYKINGNIYETLVNAFGESISFLICVPIEKGL